MCTNILRLRRTAARPSSVHNSQLFKMLRIRSTLYNVNDDRESETDRRPDRAKSKKTPGGEHTGRTQSCTGTV